MKFIVAIDGTSASGKSTTATNVAKKLGWLYLDTGAMYRAIAYYVLKKKVDPHDEENVVRLLDEIDLRIEMNNGQRTIVNGEDVTEKIRTPEIDRAVTPVCQFKKVREKMVELQRKIADNREIICEGRDMGSVVFPDAQVKVFMDASIDERAKRRLRDLQKKGINITFEEVKNDLLRRDKEDSTRSEAPLKISKGAIFIDTTNLTIEMQTALVIEEIRKKI
uniref:Cytidylate kinase n=1 Tax=candidate division WOR-3 bacterium TaxID=2052148 RepID=A0A7C4U7U8_UNCW3